MHQVRMETRLQRTSTPGKNGDKADASGKNGDKADAVGKNGDKADAPGENGDTVERKREKKTAWKCAWLFYVQRVPVLSFTDMLNVSDRMSGGVLHHIQVF